MSNNLKWKLAIIVCLICIISTNTNAEPLGKVANCNFLNFRSSNKISKYNIISVLRRGQAVTILDKKGNWIKVSYGNKTGWLSSKYVKETNKNTNISFVGYVTASKLNIRASNSIVSKRIGHLSYNQKVSILYQKGKWYKIHNGWVYYKYISRSKQTKNIKVSSNKRNSIISTARACIGDRYSYGGNYKGCFDCSGLVQYVFKRNGIKLNRTASQQSRQGRTVSKSSLRVGDILFFDTNGGRNNITHVGIYAGNNRMIHASSSRRCVIETSLSSSYWNRTYMKAKNVID